MWLFSKLRVIETWNGSNQSDTKLSEVVDRLLVEDLDLEARRRASTERNSAVATRRRDGMVSNVGVQLLNSPVIVRVIGVPITFSNR